MQTIEFHELFYMGDFSYVAVVWGTERSVNVERGRKTKKDVYLQRVARDEAMRSAQNEMFT